MFPEKLGYHGVTWHVNTKKNQVLPSIFSPPPFPLLHFILKKEPSVVFEDHFQWIYLIFPKRLRMNKIFEEERLETSSLGMGKAS